MASKQEVQRSVLAEYCQSRSAYEDVSSKWVGLVLIAIETTPLRFGEIRRKVEGISERMLSQALQMLERDGLASREVLSAMPPHVEYSLTKLGQTVREPMRELATRLEKIAGEITQARDDFDKSKSP